MVEAQGQRYYKGREMLNSRQIDLLKKLIRRFIDDIKKGLPCSDAGWVSQDIEDFKPIYNFIEKKGEYIRISLDNVGALSKLSIDDELIWS